MDNVKDNMLNEETRRKSSSPEISQVFVAETRGRSKSRGPNKDRGRSASRSRTRFNGRCHNCNLFGHMMKDCKRSKNNKKDGKDGSTYQMKEDTSNTAATMSQQVYELLSIEGECLHADEDKGISWVVDSGASFHATTHSEFFTTYKAGDFGKVKMGNDSYCNISGIGDVLFETDLGNKLLLKDVRHVPGLRLNLMSTGVLDLQGFHHHGGDRRWKLTKGSLVVARGKLCCNPLQDLWQDLQWRVECCGRFSKSVA